MPIRIEPATLDDVPQIIASAEALVATDAGRYDPGGTDLNWAARTGSAYATALVTDDDNLILLARNVRAGGARDMRAGVTRDVPAGVARGVPAEGNGGAPGAGDEDRGDEGRGDEGRGDEGRGDEGRGDEGRGDEGRGDVAGHLVGRLSGPGSVHPIRVAELESIHVHPPYRGRGVGGQLVAGFLAWATAKGAQRASVTAYAANEGAQRFYARHGFSPRSVILDRELRSVILGRELRS